AGPPGLEGQPPDAAAGAEAAERAADAARAAEELCIGEDLVPPHERLALRDVPRDQLLQDGEVDQHVQRPLKTGFRFSLNAFVPSFASSDMSAGTPRSRSFSRAS